MVIRVLAFSRAVASANGFGAVYTSTNASSGNQVLVFNRAVDGSLALQGSYATGGFGDHDNLLSHKSVILRQDNHLVGYAHVRNHLKFNLSVASQGLPHGHASGC